MSGQVPYVSQSVGMTAADAQQVGTDQTVVASTTSLTDINNVVRVAASLTGASITGNCAVSGNVSASSLAVTGAVTFSSINSTPIGATTPSTGAFTTLVGTNGASIKGTVNPTSGQSVEIYHSGSVGQIYSYDRTGSAWLPLLVYGSTVTLYGSNVLGLTVAGGGRVLVGTTTDDGVNALQVNGTAKASTLIAQQTGGVASNDVLSTTYKSGGTGSVITRLQTSSLAANVFDIETNDGSSVGYRFGTTIYDTTLSASYNGTTPWGSLKFATGGVVRMTIIGGTGATAGSVLMASGLAVSGTITPQQATTAGAPAYVKGAIYFDTTLNKLRVGGATAWETITSI